MSARQSLHYLHYWIHVYYEVNEERVYVELFSKYLIRLPVWFGNMLRGK